MIKTDASELRHVVVDEPLSEYEVHPTQVYDALRSHALQAVKLLLEASDEFVNADCPGCLSDARQPAFDKDGLHYWRCTACWTIYVSPRPNPEQMRWYFHESPYAAYRRGQDFAGGTSERAAELGAMRADWIADVRSTLGAPKLGALVDVHSRSMQFLQALSDRVLVPLIAFSPQLAVPSASRVTTAERASELPSQCAGAFLFDVIEGVSDPERLLKELTAHLETGGLLALSTRSGSGLDVQTLQGACPTVFPADHLNLLSVEGSRALAIRHGFRVLELSTPGQLDVQVLERALGAGDTTDTTDASFLHYFFKHRGAEAKARLQRFLQQTQTSSHVRMVAQRLPR